MVSVAQKKSRKKDKSQRAQRRLGMIPSKKSDKVFRQFLGCLYCSFQNGELKDAADWGIVARYLRAFAIYHHYPDRVSDDFELGFHGDMINPELEELIQCVYPDEWAKMMPDE